MGSDMYLTLNNLEGEEVQELMYWRKANHIHKWFVNNIQNGVDECQLTKVDKEKLIELREVCGQVLVDHDLASQLLPCASGFFFGSTDYDEYYFKDILDTFKAVCEIIYALEHHGFDSGLSVHYQSFW